MTLRCLTLVALAASLAGCSNGNPSAPTPTNPAPGSGPAGPNRAPEIVATMTPTLGIDHVTTFTARVEVKDPDGDPVSVTLRSLCQFPTDTPVELNGGVGVVSFKTIDRCAPRLTFTATDSKGASAPAEASAERRGLAGTFRLAIGDDVYGPPYYFISLAQSGPVVTGTLRDDGRTGVMDLQTPGTVDENGRFRLRFRVQTDTDEFVLSGELIASTGIYFGDVAIATGQVVSGRHAGRRFRIWQPAYALAPGS
jgi:hypothetical protein